MEDETYIGNRTVWGGSSPFGISRADRRQHVYAIGKTGTGKTTLLFNLICQDIERGHGVGVIDPHGDLAEELLNYIPPWRTDHVVYFNPADSEFPIGFNLVRSALPDRQYLEASGLVGAFKHLWRESWGPRLEYILYASIAALMECDNTSLLGVPRMLADARYRDWVVRQVQDPMVRAFWEIEFAKYDKKFLAEAIAPIQNKVGQLLMASPLRNVFGQVKSKIDPRFIMDNQRIFIANLSKGKLGEDKSNLLGSLLVTKFQTAAMERSNVPEAERKDYYFFIDEFHNFSTDSFAGILAEARKYHLCLSLSNQFVDQMREEVKAAVFGNVGSIISFRVGVNDAVMLANEFGNGYSPEQFTELSNHEILVKLSDNGQYRQPFLAKTEPPNALWYGRRENIIRRSRERYASRRVVVEGRIRRWLS
jgi:hypothetical protein